jgi:high affinity Mn2+ porin
MTRSASVLASLLPLALATLQAPAHAQAPPDAASRSAEPAAEPAIAVEGSVIAMLQQRGDSGQRAAHSSYRGDLLVALPGGRPAGLDGRFLAHLRLGRGEGLAAPSHSALNASAFAASTDDRRFALLAQAWYQLAMRWPGDQQDPASRLALTVGKIDPFGFFDQNAVADDESVGFLNSAFVHNPLLDVGGDIGADRYGFAAGAVLRYQRGAGPTGRRGLSIGLFDGGPGTHFSGSLGDGFLIAQADGEITLAGRPGTLRVYAWTNGRASCDDRPEHRHSGIGFSLDQALGKGLTVFARGGRRSGATGFDRVLTLGVELAGRRWQRAGDALGFAVGRLFDRSGQRDTATLLGHAAAADGDEQIAELYYRLQVDPRLALGLDLQRIDSPAGRTAASAITAVGVRAVLAF